MQCDYEIDHQKKRMYFSFAIMDISETTGEI